MIRLDLLKARSFPDFRRVKVGAVKLLTVALFLQILIFWHLSSENTRKKQGVLLLKNQIAKMEEKKKEFLAMTPPEKISGAIQARNEWFKAREKMPIFILSRLENKMPPNIELKTFETGDNGGNLQIAAPDMDSATGYLNGVLGSKNVRIMLVERVPTGIIAACTWTE